MSLALDHAILHLGRRLAGPFSEGSMYIEDEGLLFEQEIRRQQRRRDHIFVRKLRRRRGARDGRPTHDASHIGISTFGEVHSAAQFATDFGINLDVMVTLDMARMGFLTDREVRDEVVKFIKCYTEWATRGPWKLPAAWIYGIERNAAGHHAHVALFVPGVVGTAPDEQMAVNLRREFRRWCREYTDRKFGRHIPRAVFVKADRKESVVGHWRNVTYLLKGYDPSAIVQTAPNAFDGQVVYLGDLIANTYANPGKVQMIPRIRVCHSLGPARRAYGAPTGMEWQLPRQPNWTVFDISRVTPLTSSERRDTPWTLPKSTAYQSRWEAGYRDVRDLYPLDFYSFVTKQSPFEISRDQTEGEDTFLCQLRTMADALD